MQDKIEVMRPLYPPEGGRPLGFSCAQCGDVTKTKRGIWAHLRIVHGIKKQLDLKLEESAA